LDLNLPFSLFTRKFAGLKLKRKLGFVFFFGLNRKTKPIYFFVFFLLSLRGMGGVQPCINKLSIQVQKVKEKKNMKSFFSSFLRSLSLSLSLSVEILAHLILLYT
jgi:hypothetical protein